MFFLSAIILVKHPMYFLSWMALLLAKQFVIHPAVSILMNLLALKRSENSDLVRSIEVVGVSPALNSTRRSLILSLASSLESTLLYVGLVLLSSFEILIHFVMLNVIGEHPSFDVCSFFLVVFFLSPFSVL
jgi:hypothetical protein